MPASLLKKDSSTDIFGEICETFKKIILKNIYELLLLIIYFGKSAGVAKISFLILQICSINTEAAVRSCAVKMMFLKVSQNFENTAHRRLINERLRHRYFPNKFCKIFKNTYSKELRRMVAY